MDYSQHVSTRATPQSQPILGKAQVENSAGGWVFPVDDWVRLQRFLVLGSEGGTYYIGEPTLTRENAQAVERCLRQDGLKVVAKVVEISDQGRAPKNDPALFVLAMAASLGNTETRQAALAALPKVARIGTHLFHFAQYAKAFRGWGRGLRKAVANWYTEMDLDRLALQVVKYKQRDGWSHRDLLRLSHPKTEEAERNSIFKWVVSGELPQLTNPTATFIHLAAGVQSDHDLPASIKSYKLPREVLPTEALNRPEVWEALLESMPMTATLRNLGKMSAVGLVTPMSSAANLVSQRLTNREALAKARIHPITVLAALKVYSQGHGERGSLRWSPAREVVDALDDAFYLSFKGLKPTGKNTLLALDISGSMVCQTNGMPFLSCREASAAMAMAVAKTETQFQFVGFTAQPGSRGGWSQNAALMALPISGRQRLDDVVRLISNLPFGGTDCALPMLAAIQQKWQVEVFHIFTDSETWAGNIHPCQALRAYREASGIPAKLVVWGLASNGFSIADPQDGGMMDIVGLDSAAPSVARDFVAGET